VGKVSKRFFHIPSTDLQYSKPLNFPAAGMQAGRQAGDPQVMNINTLVLIGIIII
jgi:hypothetical protein